mgnify:CR=1 FL=1
MRALELINKDIAQAIAELNADAESRWEDERILDHNPVIVDGDHLSMQIGVGKYDTQWCTINIYADGWKIEKGKLNKRNTETLDLLMHNVILPMIPAEAIDEAITEVPALSATIKWLRTKKGYSLRQLAEISGVGYSHIQRIEQGHDASVKTINKLCAALDAQLKIEKLCTL